MADIINFNKARKERAKAEKQKTAAENRAKHGLSRGHKSRLQIELEKARRDLEGHRRDD